MEFTKGELYGLEHIRYGRQVWSLCKMKKPHKCIITNKDIEKGTEAYRPLTNAGNRYERISREIFEGEPK